MLAKQEPLAYTIQTKIAFVGGTKANLTTVVASVEVCAFVAKMPLWMSIRTRGHISYVTVVHATNIVSTHAKLACYTLVIQSAWKLLWPGCLCAD